MKERHQIQDVRMSLHRRHSQVRQRRRTTMAQFNTGDKTMNLRLCHSRFSVTSFLTSSCRRQRGENDCGKEGRNEFNCTLRGDLQGANTKASLQSHPTPSPPSSQTTSKTSTYISLRLLVIE
jgi:hypothetical protein